MELSDRACSIWSASKRPRPCCTSESVRLHFRSRLLCATKPEVGPSYRKHRASISRRARNSGSFCNENVLNQLSAQASLPVSSARLRAVARPGAGGRKGCRRWPIVKLPWKTHVGSDPAAWHADMPRRRRTPDRRAAEDGQPRQHFLASPGPLRQPTPPELRPIATGARLEDGQPREPSSPSWPTPS